MTPAEQNRAIAEWMGWTKIHTGYPMDGVKPGSAGALRHLIPNFHGDLNACYEAVAKLEFKQLIRFSDHLKNMIEDRDFVNSAVDARYMTVNSPADRRCEALLRTLGLWKEGE